MIFSAMMLVGQVPSVSISVVKVSEGVRPVAMAPAPQGTQVVLCLEDGSVQIIDAKTRQTVRKLAKHPGPAYAAAWSRDGVWIATGDETGRVFIEDARTGAKVQEYRSHTRGIQKVSFNVGRTLLASVGKDDAIDIQDLGLNTPKEEREILGKGSNLYGGEFNPASANLIATGILGDVGRVYDVKTGAVVGILSQPANEGTFDVSYNKNGTRFVTTGRDGVSMVWDAKSRVRLARLMGHKDWVTNATWSPSGRFIATSSTDRSVIFWNSTTFQKVAVLNDQNSVGSPICFSGDGAFFLSTNVGGSLVVHSVSPSQPAVAAPVAKKPAKRTVRKKRRG